MMSKWIVRGVLIAGVFASYDCTRRHRSNDDNNGDDTGNKPNNQAAGNTTGNTNGNTNGMPAAPPTVQQQPTGLQPIQPVQPTIAGDFIGQQMTQRQTQFAPGMHPTMPMTRGSLATSVPPGNVQNYAVQIIPGHCYKIIGVGTPSVTDLDLKLFDPANTMVDQDVATDNFPVIGLQNPLCPTTAGTYRLEVTMYAGQGDYGVQVFSN